MNMSRLVWFHSICSTIGRTFVGGYWDLDETKVGGKYYFIGYPTKPLKLLPFDNVGTFNYEQSDNKYYYNDTNCYLLVNPLNEGRYFSNF